MGGAEAEADSVGGDKEYSFAHVDSEVFRVRHTNEV